MPDGHSALFKAKQLPLPSRLVEFIKNLSLTIREVQTTHTRPVQLGDDICHFTSEVVLTIRRNGPA